MRRCVFSTLNMTGFSAHCRNCRSYCTTSITHRRFGERPKSLRVDSYNVPILLICDRSIPACDKHALAWQFVKAISHIKDIYSYYL